MKKLFFFPGVGLRSHFLSAARELIGKSQYEYLSEKCDPPRTVNCGVLVRYLLEQTIREAPEASSELLVDLFEAGVLTTDRHPGNVIFVNYPGKNAVQVSFRPTKHVSHVGILTERDSVIHACGERKAVVEDSFGDFVLSRQCIVGIFSMFEKHCCLMSQDFYDYVHKKLSPEARQAVEKHLAICDDCDIAYEHRNRCMQGA